MLERFECASRGDGSNVSQFSVTARNNRVRAADGTCCFRSDRHLWVGSGVLPEEWT